MRVNDRERRESLCKKVATGIALLSIAAGFVVIGGWIFDVSVFKSVLPGLVTMKFNSALAFVLTGLSFVILQTKRSNRSVVWLGRFCSVLALLIGVLTFFEYIFGFDLGIDQLIIVEPAGAVLTTHLGRMAILTAINFILLNLALLLSNKRVKFWEPLALLVGMISFESIVAYLFGVKFFLFTQTGFTAMAVHTAVLFFVLAVGIFLARPREGIMSIFCGDSPAGELLRFVFPLALIIPVGFGWMKLFTEKNGIFSNEIGVSLVALSNAMVFAAIVLLVSKKIDQQYIERMKAEELVRQSAEEWERTFDSITDYIFIVDKNFTIVRANAAFAKAVNLPLDQVSGKKCYEILHKLDSPWPNCPHRQTIQDKKTHTEEVNDKSIGVPLLVTTSPIFDEKGELFGSVHIAKDISKIKQAEEVLKKTKRRLDLAIEASKLGIWELDLINDTSVRNLRHDQIFGYREELDAWGAKIFFEHILAEDRSSVQAAFDRAMKSDILFIECRIVWPDGSIHWIAENGEVCKDSAGKPNQMFGTVMDITERKIKEQEIIKESELKSDFVSVVSHELRTPLSITKEGIQLILDGLTGAINEKQKKILDVSSSQIDRLTRLINDLLDISKIESKKYVQKMERLNFIELCQQESDAFAFKIKEKGLSFIHALPQKEMFVLGGRDQLIQVLSNLLSNAIKFTEKGEIELKVEERENELVCSIRDTGRGIAEGDLPKLFNKFEQLNRTAGPGEKGTGLGLVIAKGIVEKHSGKIWVESLPGVGSTFSFSLPLKNIA
ncbi:MAG: ATP-binding protein [Candidatus Margulisiibacteriota bacterium]